MRGEHPLAELRIEGAIDVDAFCEHVQHTVGRIDERLGTDVLTERAAAVGDPIGVADRKRASPIGRTRDRKPRLLDEGRRSPLLALASPLLSFNSHQIVDQLVLLRLPAIYQWPEIAEQGGLLAYGPRITRTYRQMARQLMRLMRGANMADAPVEQPTVFELVANLKTARAMDLQLPESFLTRADEVIE